MLVVKNNKGKEGIFDKNLKIVIPFEFDNISINLDNGKIIAKKAEIETNEFTPDLNIVDFMTEEEIIEESYKQISKKGDKYEITDENGNFTLLPVYYYIKPWNHTQDFYTVFVDEEYSNLSEQRYLIYKDEKVGVASDSRVITEPIYDKIILKENMTNYSSYPAFVAQKDNLFFIIFSKSKLHRAMHKR